MDSHAGSAVLAIVLLVGAFGAYAIAGAASAGMSVHSFGSKDFGRRITPLRDFPAILFKDGFSCSVRKRTGCIGADKVCSRVTCRCVTQSVEREQVQIAADAYRECAQGCALDYHACLNRGLGACHDLQRDCFIACHKANYCDE